MEKLPPSVGYQTQDPGKYLHDAMFANSWHSGEIGSPRNKLLPYGSLKHTAWWVLEKDVSILVPWNKCEYSHS